MQSPCQRHVLISFRFLAHQWIFWNEKIVQIKRTLTLLQRNFFNFLLACFLIVIISDNLILFLFNLRMIILILKLFQNLILYCNALRFSILTILEILIIRDLLSASDGFVNEILNFLKLIFPDILIKYIQLIFTNCLRSRMTCRFLSTILYCYCVLYWIYARMQVSIRDYLLSFNLLFFFFFKRDLFICTFFNLVWIDKNVISIIW